MSGRPTRPTSSDPAYETTRDAWGRIWSRADVAQEQRTREYRRSRQIRERYRPHLPHGAPILEAGCGLGVELVALADAGYQVVGLDYVVGALARLRAGSAPLRLAGGDVHALPFRDGAFGAYLSFGVLEHFSFGPVPALREAHRVLAPDGVLVLTVPAPNPIWRLARARRRWTRRPRQEPEYFETTYTAGALRDLVRETAFRVVECHPVGHSFTLWGAGGPFRRRGYYETSWLAEGLGAVLRRVMPWTWSFATLIVARREPEA
jgi:SAM-dependent methyltransferase